MSAEMPQSGQFQMLGAKRINTVKAPIILDNSVASEFLGIFASSFSAESVQKRQVVIKR